MRALDVYLHGHLAGQLVLRDNGLSSFQYGDSWLARTDAVPLSLSLPLRPERYAHRASIPFFGGVLPEGRNRRLIAGILGLSEDNDFAFLERIGGDCAGAVSLQPEGTRIVAPDERTGELDQGELTRLLRELAQRPLLAGTEGLRLSLAGAQDKLAVRIIDNRIGLPLGAAASTHILKPASADYDGLVFNEAFCLALAEGIGMETTGFDVRRVDDIDYLLLRRFDRSDDGGHVRRLHQEDFCQALGIPSERKYQAEGGPSLKQVFGLLRSVSAAPVLDLAALLDAVIFNLLIGNNDAHGKNFALLHTGEGARLAPLYDLVSTVSYPELAPEMAMRLGRQRISDKAGASDLERLAKETGMAPPLVKRRAAELVEAVLAKIDAVEQPHGVSERLAAMIRGRAQAFSRRLG